MKQTQFKMNMPVEMKRWFKIEAAKNMRSLNNEILLVLKEKMEAAEVQSRKLNSAASEAIDARQSVNQSTNGYRGANDEQFTK